MRARTTRLLAPLAASIALAVACGQAPPAPGPTAPPRSRATLVLEPPRFGVGQVALLELAVVTPPGHVPRPFAPPEELAGLWLLDSEPLPVEKEPSRWIHRTRLRLRARQAGRFVWPATRVEVEAPDGSLSTLAVDALPVEVTSILPELPDRLTPFGVRAPPGESGPVGSVWGPAAAGALAALAGVGLVALARRRRREPARDAAPSASPPGPPPWERAVEDLEVARELSQRAPFEAAHATAVALRRYVARRFGTDAAARTSEELEETTPPFAATSRWPAFLAILRSLDELRFRPAADRSTGEALDARLGGLLDQAFAFVEDSTPPEARR